MVPALHSMCLDSMVSCYLFCISSSFILLLYRNIFARLWVILLSRCSVFWCPYGKKWAQGLSTLPPWPFPYCMSVSMPTCNSFDYHSFIICFRIMKYYCFGYLETLENSYKFCVGFLYFCKNIFGILIGFMVNL